MIKLSTSERPSAVYLNDFSKFSNFQKASVFCLVKEDYKRLFSTIEKYILPKIAIGKNLQFLGCILDQLSLQGLEKANELLSTVGAGQFHDKEQMTDIIKRFSIEMLNGFEGKTAATNTTGVVFSALALLEQKEKKAATSFTAEEKEHSFEKIKGELFFRSYSYQAALDCLQKAIAINSDESSSSMIMICKFSLMGRDLGGALLPHYMPLQDREDLRFDDWIAAGNEEEALE